MSDAARFAAKMKRAGQAVKVNDRAVANRAALHVKNKSNILVRAAVPSGRMRNVGRKGSRVGVRYTLHQKSATVFMFGPGAPMLERGTKPHRIPRETAGRGRSRRRNKRPINIPGVGWRAYANHPGTAGKHPFERGIQSAMPGVDSAAADEYFGAVRKALQ